jgi:hypothetical protein
MSSARVRVRAKNVLAEIKQFAASLERIPKALDQEFTRSVARNAIDAVYGTVGQELANEAPQDSGAYAAGLVGSRASFQTSNPKKRATRRAQPIMSFVPRGSNLSLEYGTNPTEDDRPYGKYVSFSVASARPQIALAIAQAVAEETSAFIASLTARAIKNAGRPRGVRFKKSA